MPIIIGDPPDGDFSDPIRLLTDCHRRIERFLAAMIAVAKEVGARRLTAADRLALETSLRYFREAAPRHTADEEGSLFPRLMAAGKSGSGSLSTLINLQHDHRVIEKIHCTVNKLINCWLRDDFLATSDYRRLLELLQMLQEHYSQHIAQEEAEVFPLAAAVLPAEALQSIGVEMAKRRGVNAIPPLAPSSIGQGLG